jgi:hypothetical protein
MTPTTNLSTSTNVPYVPATTLYAAGVFLGIYAEAIDRFWIDGDRLGGIKLCQMALVDQRKLLELTGFGHHHIAETLAELGFMYVAMAKKARPQNRQRYLQLAQEAYVESINLCSSDAAGEVLVLRLIGMVDAFLLDGKDHDAQRWLQIARQIAYSHSKESLPLLIAQQAHLCERRGDLEGALLILKEARRWDSPTAVKVTNQRIARIGKKFLRDLIN